MACFTFADQAFLAVSAGLDPTAYAGLTGWLKADTFPLLVDSNQIGQPGNHWIDQTGGGHDGFNHTGLNLPSYETNEVGAMPIVRFTPGFNAFLNLVTPFSFAGDFTIMVVMRKSSGTNDTLVMSHSTLNHQIRRWRAGVNNASFFAGGAEQLSTNFAGANTSLHLATYRRNGIAITFRENKTDRSGATTDANTLQLDALVNNIFLSTGDMDIAEIIWYNQYRSDSEVDKLYDQYLKPRWITLP
jgi:hypothetical protein